MALSIPRSWFLFGDKKIEFLLTCTEHNFNNFFSFALRIEFLFGTDLTSREAACVHASVKLRVKISLCSMQTVFFSKGKLIQTNSGAREHLFYQAPTGSRKTISSPDVERLQWSTFTCVLGPTVKGVFPPGSDVTDVNATCRTKDCSFLASGDDFGFVNLFEYPIWVGSVWILLFVTQILPNKADVSTFRLSMWRIQK